MRRILGIDPGWGITAVRVAMAIVLIHAGWTKWFVWGVSSGVTAGMAKYGLPAPQVFAYLSATFELVGGVALLAGLFGRWLGLFYTVEFAIAFFLVKLRLTGFVDGRLEMMLLGGALLLFLAGPGRAAVDALWLEREEAPAAGELRRRAA
jgi:putative oxidoreductase